MLKISAHIGRKVPGPQEYSSIQYGASMECELSDADTPQNIQQRLRDVYSLLDNTIQEQIAGTAQQPASVQQVPAANVVPIRNQVVLAPVQQQPPSPVQRNGYAPRNRVAAINGTSNGNGRRVTCTEAQAKCIYAICKAQGLDMISILADYNVADPRDLHVRDASTLIDRLKQNGNGTAAH